MCSRDSQLEQHLYRQEYIEFMAQTAQGNKTKEEAEALWKAMKNDKKVKQDQSLYSL
jgi:hypothetical protein